MRTNGCWNCKKWDRNDITRDEVYGEGNWYVCDHIIETLKIVARTRKTGGCKAWELREKR